MLDDPGRQQRPRLRAVHEASRLHRSALGFGGAVAAGNGSNYPDPNNSALLFVAEEIDVGLVLKHSVTVASSHQGVLTRSLLQIEAIEAQNP
jgi:hypothetical protein